MSELQSVLDAQRSAQSRDPMPDLATRLERIDRCVDFLVDHQEAIVEATRTDWLHKPAAFIKAVEILPVINHARNVKKQLKGWMKGENRRPDFPFNLGGAKTHIIYQPLGMVGIMVPWNGPLSMALVAAIDAFSAGNRVMIKVSEFSPAMASLMAGTLQGYFSEEEFKIVTGEVEVSKAFAELPFDHLMYTGSSATARHIMAAASKNLVPVTLELGGKSPVLIDSDVDMNYAAQRVMSGRLINSGQGCITPDYVLLQQQQLESFVDAAIAATQAMYPVSEQGRDFAAIATDAHYARLNRLLQEAREVGCRIHEIEVGALAERRQINPAIVVNPPDNVGLMREEIFGPVLVVRTCESLDAAIGYVNANDRPLALYYFGESKANAYRVLTETTSGGAAVNEVMMQLMMSDLPFGGVGPSGTGAYWGGGAGFKRFSHAKSVFEQGWLKKIGAMLDPPYGATLEKMVAMQLKKTR